MRNLLLCSAVITLPLVADDISDFSAAPPGAWQRYDPRALASLSPPAVFDFSGNQCRIVAPQPTSEAEYYAEGGLARAGLFAPGEFTDAAASVDVTAWSPTTNRDRDGTFTGVFTRLQSPAAPLNVTGYSASIVDMGGNSGPGGVGRNGRLQLMLVYQEWNFIPLEGAGYADFPLDPTHDYRLLLVSRGNVHTARVFDLSSPAAPVAQLVGTDSNLSSGRTGVMILTDRAPYLDEFFVPRHLSIEATFDNFLAWDGAPPPLLIQPGSDPGTLALSSDFHRALATHLQSTTDLNDPLVPWQSATPTATTVNGNQLVTIFPIDGPRRFFRRKSL